MKTPEPVLVSGLFAPLLEALLEVLSDLSPDEWDRPIARSSWTVKDTALHLLGDELGILSRQRDGFSLPSEPVADWDSLVASLNRWNDEWLRAARRLSPRVLCDLLRIAGAQACAHFEARDPFATGGAVSWAGPAPAPVWLDVAREYTERWHHQQHIREALGQPGLLSPRFLAPVLDTFVWALPHTYREIEAAEGTFVLLSISGHAGGQWTLRRERRAWDLYAGAPEHAGAEMLIPEDCAWRLFTRGVSPAEARSVAEVRGDEGLALKMLDAVAIIA